VALETSNIVLPESLALSNFQKRQGEGRQQATAGPYTKGINLDDVMADIEKEYVLKALDVAQGSKQRAAELLGISFESLRYRLSKLKTPVTRWKSPSRC